MTIQQYEIRCLETKKTQRINMNPKAYVLRFAEEDGVPDEDFPGFFQIESFYNCLHNLLFIFEQFSIGEDTRNWTIFERFHYFCHLSRHIF